MKSNKIKKSLFLDNNFIGKSYINKNICDSVIEYFEKNKQLYSQGEIHKIGEKTKGVVDKNVKDSTDLKILSNYLGQPFYDYRKNLNDCLINYINKYEYCNNYPKFNVNEDYNIQKYPIGGGFKKWHFEKSSITAFKRVLVFMTYLNDVEDGGTEFFYQKLSISAEKGLTLIWPADFTHTHKGIVSYTKDKYIITGWFSLDE